MRALAKLGHVVRCYEELGSWSMNNLFRNEGERAIEVIDQFRHEYPELDVRFYNPREHFEDFLKTELKDVNVVLIHEWNEPFVTNSILALKKQYDFIALFHDSHHRSFSRAGDILKFDLHRLDGVLAFGEAIQRIYLAGFGVRRAWTFHEAADIDAFKPLERSKEIDIVWIGNWGDEERSTELHEFLIRPTALLKGRRVVAHGVRYPEVARQKLHSAGVEYRGYLANLVSPEVYARSAVTVHIPRRHYANGLAGIPTIRVFEALACGIPLVCSPWSDDEHLFHPGEDYLIANDGNQMVELMESLLNDHQARRQLGEQGRRTIHARHTCAHRAQELISICEEIRP